MRLGQRFSKCLCDASVDRCVTATTKTSNADRTRQTSLKVYYHRPFSGPGIAVCVCVCVYSDVFARLLAIEIIFNNEITKITIKMMVHMD